MAEACIGEVIEMDAEPSFVMKLPTELDSGAKLEGIAEVFSASLPVVTGGKSGGDEEVVEEEEIEVDASVEVAGAFLGGHDAEKGAKLEDVSIGECFDEKFSFHFDFEGSVFGPIEVEATCRD